ncbi:DUF4124 domain-containing protein [Dokdonella sp.]|uniref:DUF4124 domain-containing protein n=1 Tax=Dokdonella sp. TaxID=2291710 RepID=UPI001B087D48|nr:DUF4124 domain-containing protein [Dokdonella sp.]MBO9662094.1 DUF4124 domain-containing protein [Dokdonella sp.]
MRCRPSILALIVLLATPVAFAADAFKCTAADGSVSFQDRPCRDSSRQERFQLPQYAPPPPPADDAVVEATPAGNPQPPEPSVPREPPPSFFLCTRYDGSRYLSDSGIGDRYAVPYGMLSGSGRSLAQAYGGRDGIGVSAPGLRTPPTIPADEAPFATNYVQVEDECHHAAPQEACAYLRDELDRLQGKMRRAFSDTEAQLKQQQRELRARQRGC